MNKFGSGITHFDEYKSDEMTLFNGGLRSDRKSILKNQKEITRMSTTKCHTPEVQLCTQEVQQTNT